ncbi:MAG: 5'/3'-nucleotidase SurE [Myxococcales bacterium]|nr:5'/3'-nucleotidase SurE [Myxococcales bacterium]
MRILLTNDDGIHAPGIAILARVAAQFGEVWVVAPDTERSGSSHAITLFRPLRLRDAGPRWYACDGTPTDCVHLALNQLKVEPDLVLSGVNPGPNLAHDVLYSGTVAGALEGAHWGYPAVALSHCSGDEAQLAKLEARILPDILKRVIPTALESKLALNVNIPPVDKAPFAGLRVTRLGARYYSNEVHERNDPRGRMYYWIGGSTVTMPDIEGSDCNAIRDGYVSLTPLSDNLTRDSAMSPVRHSLSDKMDRPFQA